MGRRPSLLIGNLPLLCRDIGGFSLSCRRVEEDPSLFRVVLLNDSSGEERLNDMHATTDALLKEAVHYHPAVSRRGASERAFTLFFRGFVYNQIWEDPKVDVEALR